MNTLFMTTYQGSFLGPISRLFGIIMDAIYSFFSKTLGIDSIAFIIVVFTIVVTALLLPLTYQQQKFAALSRKVMPEINAVRKKYGNKKDQATMMAIQEETQAIYDKYGMNQFGSCIQLLIQFPILIALYNVFRNIPAYITSVKDIFTDLADNIMALGPDTVASKMTKIYEQYNMARTANLNIDFTQEGLTDPQIKNYIIDITYKLSEDGWDTLRSSFSGLTDIITSTQNALADVNYLFALNISDTPLLVLGTAWSEKNWAMIFGALCIPLLSLISQIVQIRFMSLSNSSDDPTAAQMKTMNRIMPLISLFFVFNVPIGLGVYWIAGAVVRTIQQIILNRHFRNMDLDKIIEKNKEKAKDKAAKRADRNARIAQNASISTRRTMTERAQIGDEARAQLENANEYRPMAQPGTMTAKANMVSEYNRKNNKN